MRRIVNGIFYILRSGCAWRYLPQEYGPWQTVYWYFRQWRRDGTGVQIHAHLRALARLHAGRDPTPSAAIIDSQSVKPLMGGLRGFDGAKQLAGRKRHILVDTQGFLLAVVVPAATSPTGKVGSWRSTRWARRFPACSASGRTKAIRVGSSLGRHRSMAQEHGIRLEVVYPAFRQLRRYAPDLTADLGDAPGFHVAPKRWIVERTFSWLGRQRRLSKDYERLPSTEEAFISLVGIRLLLRRLTRS